MTWVKLSDDFPRHAKVKHLSDAAFRLHVSALCHAGEWLTDGFIGAEDVPDLIRRYKPALVAELLERGTWVEAPGGYLIERFTKYNPSATQVHTAKAGDALRKAVYGAKLADPIKARDKSRCRFCGVAVRWTDRRSPTGGTYVLLDAAAPVEFENVVTSCRGCAEKQTESGLSPNPAPLPVPVPLPLPVPVPGPQEDRGNEVNDGEDDEPGGVVSPEELQEARQRVRDFASSVIRRPA